jgi:hypothetical protein
LRKIAAILLILLLFFNWYGYRLVISVMQDDADRKLESRIDNSDYDESQLIEISVAMNMPYQERFTDFERQYGEIEIDGKSYTYVKRKIAGDIVIFKCIANKSKQELTAIKNDLAKANSGIETDHPGKQQQQSSFAKNFWSEYDGQNIFNALNKYTSLNTVEISFYSFYIPEVNRSIPHQPPKC